MLPWSLMLLITPACYPTHYIYNKFPQNINWVALIFSREACRVLWVVMLIAGFTMQSHPDFTDAAFRKQMSDIFSAARRQAQKRGNVN